MSDNETRQKLIDSAKKEFFENGFAKAHISNNGNGRPPPLEDNFLYYVFFYV